MILDLNYLPCFGAFPLLGEAKVVFPMPFEWCEYLLALPFLLLAQCAGLPIHDFLS